MDNSKTCPYCAAPEQTRNAPCTTCGRCVPPTPHLTPIPEHRPAQWKDNLLCLLAAFGVIGGIVSGIALMSSARFLPASLSFIAFVFCAVVVGLAVHSANRHANASDGSER